MATSLHRQRSIRLPSCEELEARLCLSVVSFAPHDIHEAIVVGGVALGESWVFPTDLDGDGDMDVLSVLSSEVAWYENTDGKGTFNPQQVVTLPFEGRLAKAAAVDGDLDIDLITSTGWEAEIAWYENIDGKGIFGPQQVISDEAYGAQSVHAADPDGDGDMDVLSVSFSFDEMWEISWYENSDGEGTFGPQHVITMEADYRPGNPTDVSVYITDVDGDGDVDVLSASCPAKVAWYENIDGKGTFGTHQVVTAGVDPSASLWCLESVYAADVDGDDDVDVLSASDAGRQAIFWYENTDGHGSFGPRNEITGAVAVSHWVYAADVDGDGDVDALSASVYDSKIAWYENTDGKGTFAPQKFIRTDADSIYWFCAVDLDGDGDMDVLSETISRDDPTTRHKITWYENTQAAPGDANHDGEFNQLDIVQVLQPAKYLTGEAATWDEGDWTGDGVFDQEDIVAALAAGNYLQGSHALRNVDATFAAIQ